MQKLVTLISMFSFLSGQVAIAQSTATGAGIRDEQSALFDHLGITKQMSPKQRTDLCANALKSGRDLIIPETLWAGLGLYTTGAVGFVLGNAKKSQLAKFQGSIDTANKNIYEQLKAKSLGEGEYSSALENFQWQMRRNALQLRNMSQRYSTASPEEISRETDEFKELQNEAKYIQERYNHVFKSQIDPIKELVQHPQELTPFGKRIAVDLDIQDKMAVDLKTALNGGLTQKKIQLLFEKSDAIFNQINGFEKGRDIGQGLAVKSFQNEMYNFTEQTQKDIASAAKSAKFNRGLLYSGALLSLYGAYSIYKEASKSEAGPYSLKSATQGNVRGICQKAVADDFEPSAAHSVNSVLDFAAAVKNYSAIEELNQPTDEKVSTDGKTTK